MNIDEVAAATRMYSICHVMDGGRWRPAAKDFTRSGNIVIPDGIAPEAACDRLNLVAVLEAIREPSEAMQIAAAFRKADQEAIGDLYASVYRAMIDALIAEVKHGAG